MDDFSSLSRPRLGAMAAAGEEAADCMRVLARTGDNVVGELLRGAGTFYEWDHYPEADVFDPETHAQYFYHAHRPGEHGHFHTFLRSGGMPAKCKPAPLPDYEPPEDADEVMSHLVGISMDEHGLPIRLFTTNRWLTGEIWYPAGHVCAMLDRFRIGHAQPSWPVNRWIGAMIRLFRPQIEALLHERDAMMAERAAQEPEINHYEDRESQIVSVEDIDMDRQIDAIDTALKQAPPDAMDTRSARP